MESPESRATSALIIINHTKVAFPLEKFLTNTSSRRSRIRLFIFLKNRIGEKPRALRSSSRKFSVSQFEVATREKRNGKIIFASFEFIKKKAKKSRKEIKASGSSRLWLQTSFFCRVVKRKGRKPALKRPNRKSAKCTQSE